MHWANEIRLLEHYKYRDWFDRSEKADQSNISKVESEISIPSHAKITVSERGEGVGIRAYCGRQKKEKKHDAWADNTVKI